MPLCRNTKKSNKNKKTMPFIQWCLETAQPLAKTTLISPITYYCSHETTVSFVAIKDLAANQNKNKNICQKL